VHVCVSYAWVNSREREREIQRVYVNISYADLVCFYCGFIGKILAANGNYAARLNK
jgi:hypothetical protein